MDDIKITVDEILEELEFNKKKNAMLKPQSDMEQVNDMVKHLLTEKKSAQLKKSKDEMTAKEREEFERELKFHTKTITKQFEKAMRENTKQLKRKQRVEKLIESDKDFKLNLNDTLLEEYDENEEENNKTIENEHIKKEQNDISSHFGRFTLSGQDENNENKTFINPKTYREYKENRNKKIDKFTLNKKDEVYYTNESISLKELVDEVTAKSPINEEQEEKIKDNNISYSQVIDKDEYEDDDLDIYENEYQEKSQKEEIFEHLTQKEKLLKINTVALTILSIFSLVFCFVSLVDKELKLFKIIDIKPLTYVAFNMVLLLLAMIFSREIFFNAINSMIKRNPSKDILYSITTLIVFAFNMMMLFSHEKILEQNVHIYTPILIITLLFNFKGKLLLTKRVLGNFEYISNEKNLYGVSLVNGYKISTDMTKGVIDDEPFIAKSVKTDFFKNFLSHSFSKDKSDYICTKIAVFVFPIALFLAAFSFLLQKDLYVSMTVLSGVLVISTTLIGAMIVVAPLNDTSDITTHFSDMSPCVDAIETFENTNSVLIDAYDLFPAETVILHGIKTFSGKRIDEAIIDAASVICESKSILSNVFLDIIANNKSLLKKVDSILYEDLMGISAWVENKRVLIGNRELMINHSVAVPSTEYEEKYTKKGQNIIYVSNGGELSAAFIIQLTTKKEIFDAIALLERNEVKAVIKSVDSILTADLIADLFKLEENMVKILPSRLHSAYQNEVLEKEEIDTPLGTNGNIIGFIISTVATKKLSFCVRVGVIMNILSVVLGVAMFIVVLFTGKISLFTNLIILLYMSLFGLVYWIYQKNLRL